MGTNLHCEATWIYLFISFSTAAKISIYIYTSQHFTSSDFHITTSLSFLPHDSSLKHPKLPPDPVKGLRHRQRQNATSKASKNYLDTSWSVENLWVSVAFKNHLHAKEMSCEVLATNCYSKAGPLENTDVQPASDPFGAPSKGAYRNGNGPHDGICRAQSADVCWLRCRAPSTCLDKAHKTGSEVDLPGAKHMEQSGRLIWCISWTYM